MSKQLGRARALVDKHDYGLAEVFYSRASQNMQAISPAVANTIAIESFVERGKYGSAVNVGSVASGGSGPYVYWRVVADCELGRTDDAANELSQCLRSTSFSAGSFWSILPVAAGWSRESIEATAWLRINEVAGPDRSDEGRARWLNRASELAPHNPRIEFELGDALLRLGQARKALPLFERAKSYVSHNPVGASDPLGQARDRVKLCHALLRSQ